MSASSKSRDHKTPKPVPPAVGPLAVAPAGRAGGGDPPAPAGKPADWDRLIDTMTPGLEEFGRFFAAMFIRFTASPDDRFRFSYVSPYAEVLTGFTPDEIISDPALLTGRFHPEDEPDRRRWLRDTRARRADWLHDIRYRHRAGHYIWVRMQARRQYADDGGIEGLGYWVDISSTKTAEEGLRDKEEQYRVIVEDSLQGMAVTQDQTVRFANRAFANIFGYDDPAALIGKPSTKLWAPRERSRMLGYSEARLKGQPVPERYEFEGIRKDGGPVWLDNRIRAIPWQGGRGSLFLVVDISDRKRAEQAVLESEHRYRDLVEGTLQGMSVVQDGRVVFGNQAEARIFGFDSPAELVGQDLRTFIESDAQPSIEARRAALLRGESIPLIERKGRRRDGSPIWLQAGASLIQWQGRPAFQIFHADITSLKLAEQALSESEHRYRELIENSLQGMAVMQDDRIVFANAAEARIFGYEKHDDMVGLRTRDLLAAEELPEIKLRRAAVERGEQVEFAEQRGIRKDGSTVWIQAGLVKIHWKERPAYQVFHADVSERKHAAQALRDSEQRYRQLVDGSLQGMQVIQDGRIVFANLAEARIFGFDSQEDLTGLRTVDIMAPEEMPEVLRQGSALERGEVVGFAQQRGIRKDGSSVWVQTSAARIQWRGRAAYQIIHTDVTGRVLAEQALRESEQHYRDLVEGSIQGILIRDETRIVFANQAMADILGFSSVRALLDYGDPIGFFAPHEQERIREYAAARLSGKPAPLRYECEVIRQDGTRIWVENQSRRVDWKGGTAIQVVLYDITERKRAEQAIRESQGYLSAVLDTAADGIMVIARDGTVESFNREAERIFGYSANEVVGGNLAILFPDEHGDRLRSYFGPYFETGASQIIAIGRETSARHKDGTVFPVSVNVSEVRIGERVSFSAIVTDITERKRQEQELIETSRAKSVLLASLSHEFRTPLTAILGFVQLLRREAALTEVQRGDIETIEQSAHHLLELINDVLEVQKMEAGYIQSNREDFDLSHTMESLVAMFIPRAEAKGLSLLADIAPGVPRYVNGDARRLRQVLINLLSNAVKFTDRGSIVLSLSPEAKSVRFSVRDTGRGIAKEDLPGLMKPFRQAAITHEGTGLGLSISKSLVEIMGGSLRVSSELGAGSEFHFTLPLPHLGADDTALSLEPCGAEQEAPLRVLIVEDDPRLREWLVRLLSGEGFQADQARNGREGLQRFAGQRPHLIVTDLRMPVMDGIEFAERVRKLPGGDSIGILALSADVEFRQSADAAAGKVFDRILAKPISADELLDVLRVHAIRVREGAKARN